QREDKGSRLLTRLLSRLIEDGYEILFQDSGNEIPKHINHPKITVLDFLDDMASQLRQCDLVVLPYDLASYRVRGSGILVSCLSLGIPVVGPYDTIPGHTIERFQVGPLFGRVHPDAILAAVRY